MKAFIRVVLVSLLILAAESLSAQSAGLQETIRELYGSPEQRDLIWNQLTSQHNIPFVADDSVAFLYRGEANTVQWMGDFNGWGYDKSFQNQGTRIPGSDLWILKASFPRNARLDYKLVVDGQWILDPQNPRQQWSGVGGGCPNSELRMPQWKPEAYPEVKDVTKQGHLKKDILFSSREMGYQITYSIYFPFNYSSSNKDYPVLYVTDGYEYLHDQMGNMKNILDNLIADKKIEPLLVVFVDNREPAYRLNNRRMDELAMNEKYLRFFIQELIPSVEAPLNLTITPDSRGIMGCSMGGLSAAYFAFSRPDVFGLCGIQSPAFWLRPEIYTVCDNPDSPPVKVFLTTGTINDAEEGTKKMKSILEKNTCTFQYKEIPQGHSWGNWKDLIDDVLIYFFAPK
jgi:enterochelin esterase-like enzyme